MFSSAVVVLLVVTSVAFAQTNDVCLWGRVGSNSVIVNGLWGYQGTFNGAPYYRKDVDASWGSVTASYLWKYTNEHYYITDAAPTSSLGSFRAKCLITTSNPWTCGTNWQIGSEQSADPAITTHQDSCPEWDCDAIVTTDIGNSCDQNFNVSVAPNVWTNAANTKYWYFQIPLFEWICRNEYSAANGAYYAATNDSWVDIIKPNVANLKFSFPDTAEHTIQCIQVLSSSLTESPSQNPSKSPSKSPTKVPTATPTEGPSATPSNSPTMDPTGSPSDSPSKDPTRSPTRGPSTNPSSSPTKHPTTDEPSATPTKEPSASPSDSPTLTPTTPPTQYPTKSPSESPSTAPTTDAPSQSPSVNPSYSPSAAPSVSPTNNPSLLPSVSPSHRATTDAPSTPPTQLPSSSPSDSPTTNPTALPTADPTVTPSSSPSNRPTQPPSVAPSHSPIVDPTVSPTLIPTETPTMSPSDPSTTDTISSTLSSTDSPSAGPSKSPTTSDLTPSPTASPSVDPTTSPTTTTSRTLPTGLFSSSIRLNVTIPVNVSVPHLNQTIAAFVTDIIAKQTNVSTEQIRLIARIPHRNNTQTLQFAIIGSRSDVDRVEARENEIELEIEENLGVNVRVRSDDKIYGDEEPTTLQWRSLLHGSRFIMLVILAALVNVIILCFVYAKLIRPNDYFKAGALLTATVYFMDMISDIMFTLQAPNFMVLVMSIVFIVLPVFITLYQLFVAIKKWKRNDILSQWLSDHVFVLYMLSIITGSAFAAVAVCTSNAFGLAITNMPINKTEVQKFETKRIYSIVLLENIPQLSLQIWLLLSFGSTNSDVVYLAMTFSAFSIIVTVFSLISQRSIIRSRDYVSISMDITGSMVVSNLTPCQNRKIKLQSQIGALMGLDRELIEIERPTQIKQGLRLQINFHINNTRAIDMNLEREMKAAQQSGQLAEILKNSWKLPSVPLVSNIKYQKHESKKRRKHTAVITVGSPRAMLDESQQSQAKHVNTQISITMTALPPEIEQPGQNTPGAADADMGAYPANVRVTSLTETEGDKETMGRDYRSDEGVPTDGEGNTNFIQ